MVLDARATPQMALRMETVETLANELFLLQTCGDDRAVVETYVAGVPMKSGLDELDGELSRQGRAAGRCAAGDVHRDRGAAGDRHQRRQVLAGLAGLVDRFMPRNRELLAFRDELQGKIDGWHREHGPVANDPAGYEAFLREIGYLVPEPADFQIETSGLDPEISTICGPQLVVPVSNARYALNAANARWGSLYDALYGTDAISRDGDLAPGKGYNAKRGAAVVARGAQFLDESFPLERGSHRDATGYHVVKDGDVRRFAVDTPAGRVGLQGPGAVRRLRRDGAAWRVAAPAPWAARDPVDRPAEPDRQDACRRASPTSCSRAR